MDRTVSSPASFLLLTKNYLCLILALALGVMLISTATAQTPQPQREIFAPASGQGSVVVVVSGASGVALYRDIARKLAALGYYVVLMNGNDVLMMSNDQSAGVSALRSVIGEAQSAALALPGKVALVGFSLGGGGVLVNSGALSDLVSAVVAYYPAISFVGDDLEPLASSLRAPVLLLAAEKDERACCKIVSMRALEAAPKKVALELVVYPEAGHGFNLPNSSFVYRASDTEDAWAKTVAFLARMHPPRKP
jgi:dienelactone hydrolase